MLFTSQILVTLLLALLLHRVDASGSIASDEGLLIFLIKENDGRGSDEMGGLICIQR